MSGWNILRMRGYGVCRRKYEFEDLARIARERDISLAEARRLAASADVHVKESSQNLM